MRQVLIVLLVFCVVSSGYTQDKAQNGKVKGRNEAVGYSTRDATVLSMVGWGVILGVITAGVSVIFSDGSTNHSH